MKRVVFDVLLLISVFIFPWWISVLLMLCGIFIFKNFYELILASVMMFSIYSVPSDRWITHPAFFSALIIVFYVIIQIIKNNIIFYKK